MIDLPPGEGYFGGEPHLSPNSAAMFLRCPEQWRRRYLLNEKRRPAGVMIRGTADHAAHEVNFAQKIHTEQDIPVADVLDAYSDKFDIEVDYAGGPSEVDSDNLAKDKDIGAKMVSAYHHGVSTTIQPMHVELPLEQPIGEVLVSVKIDLVNVDGVPIERKTTAKKTNSPKPDHVLQASTYATMLGAREAELHYVAESGAITTPQEQLALLVMPNQRMVELTYERVAHSINAMYAIYGPDEPWLGGITHQWACGMCGWRPVCSYWN